MGRRSFMNFANWRMAGKSTRSRAESFQVLPRGSVCSIVRCDAPMKRIFSNPVFALAAGFCLRLFFVLEFPATSGDTAIYEEIAANWWKRHAYAMDIHGTLTPVDLRMPGYPGFLAVIFALTGKTGESARLWVMLGQVAVDIVGAIFCVWLAGLLLVLGDPRARQARVLRTAWWLAM